MPEIGAAMAIVTRPQLLARGLRLAYLTVGWNIVEGFVAVGAALAAGSVALLGFGIDSFVETASGLIIVWRLMAERQAVDHERIETVERRAQRLVAASLVGLAAYITVDAVTTLVGGEHPQPGRGRARRAIARRHVVAGSCQAPNGDRPRVACHAGRCVPDDRLLVALAGSPRRSRAEHAVRPVVGRSRRRPRHPRLPSSRGP